MNSERFPGGLLASPASRAPTATQAFVMCPMAFAGSGPCVDLYRMAYAQAQAVVRPSIIERLQRDLCN
jgi:hypothetical protein